MDDIKQNNQMEQLALAAYPPDMHKWASDPDQYDDLNEKDRGIWIEGYKACAEAQPTGDVEQLVKQVFFEFNKDVEDLDEHWEARKKATPDIIELYKKLVKAGYKANKVNADLLKQLKKVVKIATRAGAIKEGQIDEIISVILKAEQ